MKQIQYGLCPPGRRIQFAFTHADNFYLLFLVSKLFSGREVNAIGLNLCNSLEFLN